MNHFHLHAPYSSKAALVEHLLAQHSDTVFGGQEDLAQEPLSVLVESHTAGHFGPLGSAERKSYEASVKRDRREQAIRDGATALPILSALMAEVGL